jgi:hypothetical protein
MHKFVKTLRNALRPTVCRLVPIFKESSSVLPRSDRSVSCWNMSRFPSQVKSGPVRSSPGQGKSTLPALAQLSFLAPSRTVLPCHQLSVPPKPKFLLLVMLESWHPSFARLFLHQAAEFVSAPNDESVYTRICDNLDAEPLVSDHSSCQALETLQLVSLVKSFGP